MLLCFIRVAMPRDSEVYQFTLDMLRDIVVKLLLYKCNDKFRRCTFWYAKCTHQTDCHAVRQICTGFFFSGRFDCHPIWRLSVTFLVFLFLFDVFKIVRNMFLLCFCRILRSLGSVIPHDYTSNIYLARAIFGGII